MMLPSFRSRRLFWLAIIALALLLLAAASRGLPDAAEDSATAATIPLAAVLRQIERPFRAAVNALGGVFSLQSENERFHAEVARLTAEIVRLREAETENQRLRALLDFRNREPSLSLVVANIIGADTSNLIQSVVIDKGRGDGVREGMAVVAGAGLVGRVTRAYDRTARVLLVIDPSSSVSAMVQSSRALGVVRGRPGGGLVMDYLSQSKDVAVGDIIVTSGLGGGFPKGLAIGQVRSIRHSDVELFQDVSLEPAIDFGSLEEVLVVTSPAPQVEP